MKCFFQEEFFYRGKTLYIFLNRKKFIRKEEKMRKNRGKNVYVKREEKN